MLTKQLAIAVLFLLWGCAHMAPAEIVGHWQEASLGYSSWSVTAGQAVYLWQGSAVTEYEIVKSEPAARFLILRRPAAGAFIYDILCYSQPQASTKIDWTITLVPNTEAEAGSYGCDAAAHGLTFLRQ